MAMIHTLPNNGQTNDWLTPKWLHALLGEFDPDPCGHKDHLYRTAKKIICPPRDGLKAKWTGRVWLNPPYGSQIKDWLKKMAKHGWGMAVGRAGTEVESWFWPYI